MSLSIPKLEMKYSETLSLQNRLLNKTLKLHLTGVCSDVHKLTFYRIQEVSGLRYKSIT